jgi:hypothetical protein
MFSALVFLTRAGPSYSRRERISRARPEFVVRQEFLGEFSSAGLSGEVVVRYSRVEPGGRSHPAAVCNLLFASCDLPCLSGSGRVGSSDLRNLSI